MVLQTVITKPTSCENSDDEEDSASDCISTISSKDDSHQGDLILSENNQLAQPSYGNIAINNSNDVHFGNKTFYHGPVTIKQFLYTNGRNSDGATSASDSDTKLAIKGEISLDPKDLVNGVDNPTFRGDIPNLVTYKEHFDGEPENSRFSSTTKGLRRIQVFCQLHLYIIISVLAVLMLSLSILVTVLLIKHSPTTQKSGSQTQPYVPKEDTDEQDFSKPLPAPIDPTVNFTLPPKLKIVSRIEWVAQPPSDTPTKLNIPVPYVIIMHTATANCSSKPQCIFHVRYIQMFHIESNNWWDIGYNFLVGGDGNAYEGRGWTAEGAHTYGYNARSIGIAFIGTFTKIKPSDVQMTACKQLIAKGVELGYISKNYKLLAARQLQVTESPGELLYQEIKTWPHWAPSP